MARIQWKQLSNNLGETPLTGSLLVSGTVDVDGDILGSFKGQAEATGSFTGSFIGSAANLVEFPVDDIVGRSSKVFYVSEEGLDTNNGRTPKKAFRSIKAACIAASSSFYGAHTFVSALTDSIKKHNGNFTVNVGALAGTYNNLDFASSTTDAIVYKPQSTHTFLSASDNALRYTPQANHTFVRTTKNSIITRPTVFDPSLATLDPSTGEFVVTLGDDHRVSVGDYLKLGNRGFTFQRATDHNRGEYRFPQFGQESYNKNLLVVSASDTTVTVNVGEFKENRQFNVTDASYNPADGNLVLTILSSSAGDHNLRKGEEITLENESISFTCDMDYNKSTKSYPRPGIDPFASRSIAIADTTDDTITLYVGVSRPNLYFSASDASFDPSTGILQVTASNGPQLGLGVNRGVVFRDETLEFTVDGVTKLFPQPSASAAAAGSGSFSSQSYAIQSVSSSTYTVEDAPYNAATGEVVITITGHGFSDGDYVKLDDSSLTYTCVLDDNTVEKSYPRPGYDLPSGRWLKITGSTTDNFKINIGSSSYTGSHTFVSATTDGLKKHENAFSVNIGVVTGTPATNTVFSGSVYAFQTATSASSIAYEPQASHSFASAIDGAVKFTPRTTYTYVRNTDTAVQSTSIEDLDKVIAFTATDATYNTANGDFVITLGNGHGLTTADSIQLRPQSFVFTCTADGGNTEDLVPAAGQLAYSASLQILTSSFTDITVNVGASQDNKTWTPTDASYDPEDGTLVLTITGDASPLKANVPITLATGSLAFTCDMDRNQKTKSYPRLGIDPFANRSIKIQSTGSSGADTTITFNVGKSRPNLAFSASDASYNPSTGLLQVTASNSQHGIGVERGIVITGSLTFNHSGDSPSSPPTFELVLPQEGLPSYTSSINIQSVGTTSHTPTDLVYDPRNGRVVITIADHGFSNGDYIKIDDSSITLSCEIEGYIKQQAYPRPGYDLPSGRWIPISDVTRHTFVINVGSSPYKPTATTPPHRQSIHVKSGNYNELAPITVPEFVSILGDDLRTTVVSPTIETKNQNLFLVNNGFYAAEMRFEGCELDSLSNPTSGFYFAFAPGAYISTSPYVQNCTANHTPPDKFYSALDYTEGNPLVGNGPGGMLVDSEVLDRYSPLNSMHVDAYTQVAFNGIGICLKGKGYAQLVSFFTNFNHIGVLAQGGGHASLLNSNTTFGDYGLRSEGSRLIVEPDISNIPTLKDSASAAIVSGSITTIQKYVTDQLTGSAFYSSSYVSSSGEYYDIVIKDTDVLIKSICDDLLDVSGSRTSQFASNIFTGRDTSANTRFTLPTPADTTFSKGPVVNWDVSDGGELTLDFIQSWRAVKTFLTASDINGGTIYADVPENTINKLTASLDVVIDTADTIIISGSGSNLISEFGSLVTSTSHDFSYAGSGVNFLGLPVNQGGRGETNFDLRVFTDDVGRVFHTSGDETGDFYAGEDFVIRQATGTIEGRTFRKALGAIFTPLNLALES